MNIVSEITDEPKQKHVLNLPDGTSLTMILEYKPLQIGWFIQQLTYDTFTINNLKIVTSPNILYQFKNKLPFGIAIAVTDNDEATQAEDFQSGRAIFYLLTQAEVTLLGQVFSGQV